ncbi:sigma-70 family RNA polymerase sigma factor [Pseudomonas sp. MYb118]|uniref:sigma-70 family RNA polymerase sigma factor n=1 Tax=Pseudomonas sp. MYb118 TaxID=1848720 RepID=UPI0034CFE6B1
MPDSPDVQQLYRSHHSWLVGWLFRQVQSRCDAADLSQETFLRLLTGSVAAQDLREPRAYLSTIARRLMLNLYRRRSLERAYLEALATVPPEEVPSAEHHAAVLEALNAVDALLCGLPEKVRRAFLLAQLEGYTQEQIAEVMGVTVRSVHRYLSRALEECIVMASRELV